MSERSQKGMGQIECGILPETENEHTPSSNGVDGCVRELQLSLSMWEMVEGKERSSEEPSTNGSSFQPLLKPFLDKVLCGDCEEILTQIPYNSVDAIITSPPYYRQREYGVETTVIGNEESLDAYLNNLVRVFQRCLAILKPTGSLFVNLGDKYEDGSLLLVPYLFAHRLTQTTGAKLINLITWVKPNPEPRQYKRRLVSSTEPIFHFVKTNEYKYFYDRFCSHRDVVRKRVKGGDNIGKRYLELIEKSDLTPEQKSLARKEILQAIQEVKQGEIASFRVKIRGIHSEAYGGHEGGRKSHLKSIGFTVIKMYDRAIRRDVIECPILSLKSLKHPAVYPEYLVQELLKLTTQPGDVVLDPFLGSGTTAVVAKRMGRHYIGIEINPDYCEIANSRLESTPVSPDIVEFYL